VELRDAMTNTPTIRHFLPDPVSDGLLHRVLDAARFAPSGGNRQGWRVIAVRDPAMRRRLHDLYQLAWRPYRERIEAGASADTRTRLASRSLAAADAFADHLYAVPLHLVVCVDLSVLQVTDAALERQSIVGGASVYPFVQNLLLAARDAGLGVALTTLLVPAEDEVRRLLDIPGGFAVAALVAAGFPDPDRVPRTLSRRPVEAFAFRERFGGDPVTANGARP
jgi:nitroreductase